MAVFQTVPGHERLHFTSSFWLHWKDGCSCGNFWIAPLNGTGWYSLEHKRCHAIRLSGWTELASSRKQGLGTYWMHQAKERVYLFHLDSIKRRTPDTNDCDCVLSVMWPLTGGQRTLCYRGIQLLVVGGSLLLMWLFKFWSVSPPGHPSGPDACLSACFFDQTQSILPLSSVASQQPHLTFDPTAEPPGDPRRLFASLSSSLIPRVL